MSKEHIRDPKLATYLEIIRYVEELRFWYEGEQLDERLYGNALVQAILIAEEIGLTPSEIQAAKHIGESQGLKRKRDYREKVHEEYHTFLEERKRNIL